MSVTTSKKIRSPKSFNANIKCCFNVLHLPNSIHKKQKKVKPICKIIKNSCKIFINIV